MLRVSWTQKGDQRRDPASDGQGERGTQHCQRLQAAILRSRHIMRNESRYQLQCILQSKIYGKSGPNRRWISWLKNLRT